MLVSGLVLFTCSLTDWKIMYEIKESVSKTYVMWTPSNQPKVSSLSYVVSWL